MNRGSYFIGTWSFLTKSRRSYAGNLGYDDMPEGVYNYDSNVANSRRVQTGDLVLVRDADYLLGVSTITEIESTPGTKAILRCPRCGRPGIKARVSRVPTYRCYGCANEFDRPTETAIEVTKYTAHYAENFLPVPRVISRDTIKAAAFRPATQLSIESIDLALIETQLRAIDQRVGDLLDTAIQKHSLAGIDGAQRLAGDDDESPFEGSSTDTRGKILRHIRQRRGQSSFRKSLLRRYGQNCQITACSALDVLEAAHIWPYRGDVDNDVRNGLLLRADIHTLFDLNLIAIHPETLRVHVAPDLETIPEYSSLQGRALQVQRGMRPAKSSLERRWSTFKRVAA